MTIDQAQATFTAMIHEIAPEIDLEEVDREANLQDELDLDSVDFLNLIEMIYERTGLDIPESEYDKLSSINSAIAYLAANAS